MYTTSQNHSHSRNHAHSQIHAHGQNYAHKQKACSQSASITAKFVHTGKIMHTTKIMFIHISKKHAQINHVCNQPKSFTQSKSCSQSNSCIQTNYAHNEIMHTTKKHAHRAHPKPASRPKLCKCKWCTQPKSIAQRTFCDRSCTFFPRLSQITPGVWKF